MSCIVCYFFVLCFDLQKRTKKFNPAIATNQAFTLADKVEHHFKYLLEKILCLTKTQKGNVGNAIVCVRKFL